jgi:hypothetical protein
VVLLPTPRLLTNKGSGFGVVHLGDQFEGVQGYCRKKTHQEMLQEITQTPEAFPGYDLSYRQDFGHQLTRKIPIPG